jgi:diguanylate cyclase (GGDEF)-like protein
MEKGIILVVDDTPTSLLLLSKMLEGNGYDVRIASSGKHALISAQANSPDLILLDINMPEMSGYQVCQKLKQNPITKEIPVIFISSFSDIGDKLQGFSVGGSDYITKDFQIEEVLARVENLLTIRRLQKKLEQQNSQFQLQNARLQIEIRNRIVAEERLQAAIFDLEHLVNLDGLTGVANRRRFDDFLECSWQDMVEEQGQIALIMCDVDFFKNYNDTYGHLEGDKCLQKIASCLQQQIRKYGAHEDMLLARYGGEEFAIILPKTSIEQSIAICEKLREEIKQLAIPHISSKVNSRVNSEIVGENQKESEKLVTLSLGTAGVIPSGNEPYFLIKMADRALYEAKNRGRDQTCYIKLDKYPDALTNEIKIEPSIK